MQETETEAFDRQQALVEIGDTIASCEDSQQLLTHLAAQLRRVLEIDYLSIVVPDDEPEHMRLYAYELGSEGERPSTIRVPKGESPSFWVMDHQLPLFFEDGEGEDLAARFPQVIGELRRMRIRSMAILPLSTPLGRIGAAGLGSRSPGKFVLLDLPFLQRVANQVAISFGNVRNFEAAARYQRQLAHQRDRLRLLLDVNNAIAARLSLPELCHEVGRALQAEMPADVVAVAVVEQENLRSWVAEDLGNPSSPLLEELSPLVKHPLTQRILAEKRPQLVGRFDEFRTEVSAASCPVKGAQSGCIVPLVLHGRATGAFYVGSRRESAFSDQHCELLVQIATQVALAVDNALAFRKIEELTAKLTQEQLYLRDEIEEEYADDIVGSSPRLVEVLNNVRTVAPTDSTVLILGETGTGKELVARAIHKNSHRGGRTFVKLNCSAIPTGLLESELFGHEKGAFTGAIAQKIGRLELADRGTLFLDEIGDIPQELQPKLLRVLQEREFERLGSNRTIRADIRLIAATNRDLSEMVAKKEFRSDLYYRLNVFPIRIAPLRDRQDDIPRLVRHFASRHAQRMGKQIESIPAETMARLQEWSWPGNVRELENFMERAVILTNGPVLNVPVAELRDHTASPQAPASSTLQESPVPVTLEDSERAHILRALRQANGVLSGPNGAATRLGIKRSTLQSRMQKLGITKDQVFSFPGDGVA